MQQETSVIGGESRDGGAERTLSGVEPERTVSYAPEQAVSYAPERAVSYAPERTLRGVER